MQGMFEGEGVWVRVCVWVHEGFGEGVSAAGGGGGCIREVYVVVGVWGYCEYARVRRQYARVSMGVRLILSQLLDGQQF